MHGPHFVRSIRLECQNKYFLVWTSSLVNKSILFPFIVSKTSRNTANQPVFMLIFSHSKGTLSMLIQKFLLLSRVGPNRFYCLTLAHPVNFYTTWEFLPHLEDFHPHLKTVRNKIAIANANILTTQTPPDL